MLTLAALRFVDDNAPAIHPKEFQRLAALLRQRLHSSMMASGTCLNNLSVILAALDIAASRAPEGLERR